MYVCTMIHVFKHDLSGRLAPKELKDFSRGRGGKSYPLMYTDTGTRCDIYNTRTI